MEAEALRRFFTWALPVLLLLICVPLVLFLLAGTLGARADQEALALAEESVRRAAEIGRASCRERV